MRYILVYTEGQNSEPEFIQALNSAIFGNAAGNAKLEVRPIPLAGNHGYNKLVERAQETAASHEIRQYIDENDSVEEYLICDYDDMEDRNIGLADLRSEAEAAGFKLIVNMPCFEGFVLRWLMTILDEDIARIADFDKRSYIAEINKRIGILNKQNPQMPTIPKYGKHKFQGSRCFHGLMSVKVSTLRTLCSDQTGIEGVPGMEYLVGSLFRLSRKK